MIFQDQVMPTYQDPRLVVLSILISILAAYAARELIERIRDARGRAWMLWLVGGAIVDGIGTVCPS
jgi:NO-binding membrane sensor protein with MHYT domain